MRIDFRAAFTKIDRLLEARPPQGPQQSNGDTFSSVLAGITPKPAQDIDNLDGSGIKPRISGNPLGHSEGDQMASFNFKPPHLQAPPQLSIPVPSAPPQVNLPKFGVKDLTPETPHLIDAKRVPISEELKSIVAMPTAERMQAIKEMVGGAGTKYGIDPALGMAVAAAESSFDPLAVSSDGHASKGLFQLLDTTGSELHENSGLSSGYDPFNPKMNVDLGVSYLRRLHDLFSSETTVMEGANTVPAANSASLEKLAVAAFNAGEGRVTSAQARAVRAGKDASQYDQVQPYLPESTQQYVTRVLALRDRFSAIG